MNAKTITGWVLSILIAAMLMFLRTCFEIA